MCYASRMLQSPFAALLSKKQNSVKVAHHVDLCKIFEYPFGNRDTFQK